MQSTYSQSPYFEETYIQVSDIDDRHCPDLDIDQFLNFSHDLKYSNSNTSNEDSCMYVH